MPQEPGHGHTGLSAGPWSRAWEEEVSGHAGTETPSEPWSPRTSVQVRGPHQAVRDPTHEAWGRCLRREALRLGAILRPEHPPEVQPSAAQRPRPRCRQSHQLHFLSLQHMAKESPPQAQDTMAFKEPEQNLLERPKEECFLLRQNFQNNDCLNVRGCTLRHPLTFVHTDIVTHT